MEQSPQKNPRRLGFLLVGSTFAVLLLILIISLTAYFLTGQNSSAGGEDNSLISRRSPLDMVDVDRVDPALALASLGGMPELDVITEALDKARPETAFAAVLYQPALSDRNTAGSLLLLAAKFAAKNDEAGAAAEKAIFCYKLAGTVATLSPELPDAVRSDLFIQIGEGLIALDQADLAKFYLKQAFIIAENSPYLQAVQRRTIFERLQRNYLILGERKLARTSLNLSANPPPLSNSETAELPVLPNIEEMPLSAEAQQAEANRWLSAQELAAIMVDRGGKAPPENIEALRQALLVEDKEKLAFYGDALEAETRLSKKIDITAAKIEWLSIKYRIARQGFGVSLVPEWEASVEQIRTNLTKTYEQLFALYADLIVALPEVSKIDRATYEKLRREILVGELGRYPNYPEEQRRQQLIEAAQRLAQSRPELKIFVGTEMFAGKDMYTLTTRQSQSAEE